MTRPDFAKGSVQFAQGSLIGVDFNKIHAASAEHATDMRSLGEPPSQTNHPIRIFIDWVAGYPKFWLSTFFITIIHSFVYLFFFALVLGVTSILQPASSELSEGIVEQWFGSDAPKWAQLFTWSTCIVLFTFLYLLNVSYDVVYKFHARWAVVPTWLKFLPRSVFDEIIAVEPGNIHLGLLKIGFGFNDHALFIRSVNDHSAMILDFAIITDVKVERNFAARRWRGKFGTSPVKITVGEGLTQSILMIHGSYFEGLKGGEEKARKFVDALNEKRNATPRSNSEMSPH